MRFHKTLGCTAALLFTCAPAVWAAHPLISDDAGTVGKGGFQLEINGQYDHDKETERGLTVRSTGWELGTSLTYGIANPVDVVLGMPYQWSDTKENGIASVKENGFADMSIEVKWRFYEKEGLGLSLKPGLNIPTGDEDKGLGSGEIGYSAFLIASKELDLWSFHLNLGYIGNENDRDERESLWHVSLATERKISDPLKAVANIGIERNPDRASDTDPAFILGGLIYSPAKHVDLDCGVKAGLTSTEVDYSLLAGMTLHL